MRLSYVVSKIPSKCLYNVNLLKNNLPFGNINFNISNNIAYLNNLEVFEHRKGFGSYVLNTFESYIKNFYNIERINLLAWQSHGLNDSISFFKKQGYFITDPSEKIQTYDDGIIIYDLHKMSKII